MLEILLLDVIKNQVLWYTSGMENVKIIAIVGMSGSGKSVLVDYLTGKG